MASITTMVRQCAGLVGTKDVSHWEETFLDGICERTRDCQYTKTTLGQADKGCTGCKWRAVPQSAK